MNLDLKHFRLVLLDPLRSSASICGFLLLLGGLANAAEDKPRNIVFLLVDDQRHDALSCAGHPFLQTPAADSIAAEGVRFRNAYVTTSLCSPSRATILSGLYAHSHRVVDNQSGTPEGLVFFGEYLQRAGYDTAFIGKWHMGHDGDEPRRGWDHWVSFVGQGNYFPELPNGKTAQLNIDGKRVDQTKYITDELTDYAVEWLRKRKESRNPWMLYLSHKAVHHDFSPAPRHLGKFEEIEMPSFPSTAGTPADERKPMWARNQRNSWHGAEFPFHGSLGETEDIYRRYCEAMLSVDESTGRVLDVLKEMGADESTLVIYMADNGHLWGEQGLIDKRTAYEASIRVPLLMRCPELFEGGRVVEEMAANLDIAPTVLDAAGIEAPAHYQGASLLPLAKGEKPTDWRTELVYEYFWERWAPSTPTIHALVTPRWKFVRAYGLWDLHELYDLRSDPDELNNLYHDPEYRQQAMAMDQRLFEMLGETGGHSIPLMRGWKGSAKELRDPDESEWAPFPEVLFEGRP